MDSGLATKIKDLLSKHQLIGIVVGNNHNLDDMGAALGLYLALQQLNKNASIASPADLTVGVSSLVGIDKVRKTIGGEGGDLTVSFPYKDGEIEKVSYTLESGLLNIIVKTGEKGLSFQDKDVLFKRGGAAPTLLFVVGVPRLTDLGHLYKPESLKDTTVVNIDYRPENQGFGDVVVVSPTLSSVSEQIADLLLLLEPEIRVDVDIAQNLLSGIAAVTSDFSHPRTSYLAFEMAGKLMKKGAVRTKKADLQQEPAFDMNAFFPPTMPPMPRQMPRQPMPQPFQQQPMQRPQPRMPQQPFPSMPQPQYSPFSMPQNQSQQRQPRQTPPDWLTPKVYKGSTVV